MIRAPPRFTHSRVKPFIVMLLVIAGTVVAAALGAFGFSSLTEDNYNPTPSCEDYDSYKEIQSSFPLLLDEDTEVVLVRASGPNATLLGNTTDQIFAQVTRHVNAVAANQSTSPLVGEPESYFTFAGTDLAPLGFQFLVPSVNGAILAVHFDSREADAMAAVVTSTRAFTATLNETFAPRGFEVVMTGRVTTTQIAQKTTGKGFAIADGSGLPFIVVIFWAQVGSFRLLLLPGLALACSLILSYGFGALIAANTALSIPSYQPNIMLFLCLALSIDYSFFLLTRLQEERKKGEAYEAAVWTSFKQSGETIVVSGSILVVTWCALCFFPVYGLDAIGYCSAITVAVCMLVNLLITPSALLAFPSFFDAAGFSALRGLRRCCCCYACGCREDPRERRGYAELAAGADQRASHNTALLSYDYTGGTGAAVRGKSSSSSSSLSSSPMGGGGSHAAADAATKKKNCYHRLARVITRKPWSILAPLVVFGLLTVGVVQLKDLDLTLAANVDFGTGAAATAYGQVIGSPAASVFATPFTVLLTVNETTRKQPKVAQQPQRTVPASRLLGLRGGSEVPATAALPLRPPAGKPGNHTPSGGGNSTSPPPPVLNAKVFEFACALGKALAADVPGIQLRSLQGVAFAIDYANHDGGLKCVTAATAAGYLGIPLAPSNGTASAAYAAAAAAAAAAKDPAAAAIYRYEWLREVNTATNRSTSLTFAPDFNPFSTRSRAFVKAVRSVLEAHADAAAEAGVQTWLFHPMVTEVDAEAFTFSRFPYVLAVALLLAFLLIAVRFRAALIPLKLALTIVLPIAFLFGAAVAVYQKGALDFLHISALSSGGGANKGVSWLIPCSTIFVLIGLALDYDIFLFSRVYELRTKGSGAHGVTDLTRAAIIEAVEITGPVISGAGVICALAFLGMLVNTNAFLNQFGFIMILGILLDTFVVRVILVPSMLSLGGWLNWWPKRMPGAFTRARDISGETPQQIYSNKRLTVHE